MVVDENDTIGGQGRPQRALYGIGYRLNQHEKHCVVLRAATSNFILSHHAHMRVTGCADTIPIACSAPRQADSLSEHMIKAAAIGPRLFGALAVIQLMC